MLSILSFLRLSGILGWIKMGTAVALLSAIMYLAYDYRNLAEKVTAQRAEITVLKNNIKSQTAMVEGLRAAMGELDTECSAAAERFIRDNEIAKRIEQSADPLTDAGNYDPNGDDK